MNLITALVLAFTMSLNTSCKKVNKGDAQAFATQQELHKTDTNTNTNTNTEIKHDEANPTVFSTESKVEEEGETEIKKSKVIVKAKPASRVIVEQAAATNIETAQKEVTVPIVNTVDQALTKEADLTLEKHSSKDNSVLEAADNPKEEISSPKVSEPIVKAYDMHTEWNKLLQTYVSSKGKVDYAGIKAERNRLDGYIAMLANNPPAKEWSKDKKLAYWINVYNAHTVLLVINNYPVKSIMDLEAGKPWDKKFVKVGGQRYTLNHVENEIIRPRFKEARIHFAVNCGAVSCPPLANKAFTEENLESLLTKQTTQFLNNGNFNTISSSGLKLSKIFDWYKADFPALVKFISKYTKKELSAGIPVEFLEYDWALNGK